MVQFLPIIFFLGFLQFLLGFSKVPVFLCHPVHEYQQTVLITSRSVLLRIRNISEKICRQFETYILCSTTCIRLLCLFVIMWKNKAQPNMSQMTIKYGACALHAITKAIDTHSVYIIQRLFPSPRQRY